MNDSLEINSLLEVLSKILVRCFIIGIVFLLFWFCVFSIGGDMAYGIHSRCFDLSRQNFDLMNYYGMAFLKMSIFLFFLFPYISIRLILTKGEKTT